MTDPYLARPISALASRLWWMMALRGGLALIVGIVMLVWPKQSIGVAAVVFGVFVLINGISNIVSAFVDHEELGWGWILTFGILEAVLGFIMIVWPIQTAALWVLVIACWALVAGIFAVIGGIVDREALGHSWVWTVVWGGLTVLLGLLMIGQPGITLVALFIVLGCYAIIIGLVQIVAGIYIRRLSRRVLPIGTNRSA